MALGNVTGDLLSERIRADSGFEGSSDKDTTGTSGAASLVSVAVLSLLQSKRSLSIAFRSQARFLPDMVESVLNERVD